MRDRSSWKRSRDDGARAARDASPPGGRPPPDVGPSSRLTLLLLLALGIPALGGCDAFSAPEREEARAVVTTEEEAEVRIVTSTMFTLSGDDPGAGQPSVALEEADTSVVIPPFDRTFDISETRRFFIRVEPTDTASVQATLEVFIDGESLGPLAGDLQDDPLQDVFASAEF